MPTYRITDRATGKILDPAMQADSEFSAIAGYDVDVDYKQTSPNPPATVYTVVYQVETPTGSKLVESFSTGSRPTALDGLSREPPGRTLIDESVEINRLESRKRRR